ncbi:uncharacterized protein LOC111325293 isoform X3 [Stylophora pistillata]|uniref:uncharacterized protein LOC111325293 isoform X3 n=1 Tax=Stylophora pistillata TaxID=50429 RepID=UPI000C0491DB|nr:uncharacterized protein LOC111325293 isoform X3 [Stylophora pistillata]
MPYLSLVVSFVTVLTSSKYQVTDEANTSEQAPCVYMVSEEEVYNLTSLANINHKPRFRTESRGGYRYSYNPCFSFKLGPKKESSCRSNVAICRWVEGHEDSYVNIGHQSSMHFDGEGKIPKLRYYRGNWIAIVSLVCELSENKGKFKVVTDLESGDMEFNLSHKCACPNKCVISPTTKPRTTAAPADDEGIVVPVVASVAGAICLFAVPYIIWRLVRQPPNDVPPAPAGAPAPAPLHDQICNPLLGENLRTDYGAVGGIDNPSSASEPPSGSESSSSTKPASTSSSSCSDIRVSSKESSKNENRSYVC